jgi:glycosyltransferase involved in cell wall biosynthesis
MRLSPWTAVIPAFNAASTIQTVIIGVSKYIPIEAILIVDDGSRDDTAQRVNETGASLLRRSTNGGKGRALRDGFAKILDSQPEWIICLDADGQHDPTVVPRFQEAAGVGPFDLLIGDRTGDLATMPLPRRFSNLFSSTLISWRTGNRIHDAQCGFRAVRASFLRDLRLKAENYEIEVEMILKTWQRGGKIGWVPIPTIYQGEPSFIRKFPETMRFLRLLIRSYYE